jgi:hypothetical protein
VVVIAVVEQIVVPAVAIRCKQNIDITKYIYSLDVLVELVVVAKGRNFTNLFF